MEYTDIKLEDKTRNFAWIKERFDSQELYIRDQILTESNFAELRKMIILVKEIYDDSWDLDFELKDNGNFNLLGIVIHFPHIDLSNRDEKHHQLEDLFVRISLYIKPENKGLAISGLQGMRTTISYEEYCSNYFHSHLSTNTFQETLYPGIYQNFCTGSGEIVMYQSNFNSEEFNEDTFRSYLLQIISLVSYESIEGTPFRYISNLGPAVDSSTVWNRPSKVNIEGLISFMYEVFAEKGKMDIDFGIAKDRYVVLLGDNFTNKIKEYVEASDNRAIFFCSNSANGYIRYEASSNGSYTPRIRDTKYIFQGKEFPMVVKEVPEVEDMSNKEYTIHPSVLEEIKNKIENEINNRKIRESTIKRYTNSVNSDSRSIKQDQVPV